MSVIATVEFPAEEFMLGEALVANPGIQVSLERVVPLESTFIPYFWAEDDSVEEIERALRTDADIESFEVVERVDNEALVRVEWTEDLDGFLDAMDATGGTILQGVGSADRWRVQLRFDDHESLTDFYRQCRDRGLTIDLQSVHNPGIPAQQGLGLGITETQRETLLAALERGYFDVPRQVNLTELAAEMGISDTAASQRIRRGITALLNSTLSEPDDESDE